MAESGVALAIVVDNKDDSGAGRVRVRLGAGTGETLWARVATPMAGARRGVFFMPEEGDEVLVAFEGGDARRPYVLGSLWNGKDKAPVTNADGKNDVRLIRTRKGHLLTFDDGANGRVDLALNDGKHVSIDDDGIRLEDEQGNGLTIQSRAGALEIHTSGSIKIKASQISIESSGKIDVKAAGTLTLVGALVSIN
jgi:uncharacterized protein involved in type VI secretion and phage assembly